MTQIPSKLVVTLALSGDAGDIDCLSQRIKESLGTDFRVEISDVRIYGVPVYSQISDSCPACSHKLNISGPELDFSNGAAAEASCTACGWGGVAEYRLIDLLTNYSISTVRAGDVEPSYFPY